MIVHADNFNYYGVDEANMLDGVYATVTNSDLSVDPDGLSTTRCLKVGGGSHGEVRYVLPSASATVGAPLRLWQKDLPSATSNAFKQDYRNGTNVTFLYWRMMTTGGIELYDGSDTLLAATSGPVVTAAGWYHIESKLTCSATSSSDDAEFELRVEGVSVLTHSGFSTTESDVDQLGWGQSVGSTGMEQYIKDLVVWDGSGSQNNDFLGSVLVYEMIPTSDVSFPTGWTSTDANGFSVLDNDPPDDTAHYISADDTPPAAATFGLSDLPDDITSVKALLTRVRAAKSDGGDGQLQVSLVSNGTDDDGTDRPITTAETYWTDVSELDPDTASAWTPTSANAAQLKLTRTL